MLSYVHHSEPRVLPYEQVYGQSAGSVKGTQTAGALCSEESTPCSSQATKMETHPAGADRDGHGGSKQLQLRHDLPGQRMSHVACRRVSRPFARWMVLSCEKLSAGGLIPVGLHLPTLMDQSCASRREAPEVSRMVRRTASTRSLSCRCGMLTASLAARSPKGGEKVTSAYVVPGAFVLLYKDRREPAEHTA